MNLAVVKKQIFLVTKDMRDRFPGCDYTIKILLWNDYTTLVECRYGTADTIHLSVFYKGELSYKEIKVSRMRRMIVDEFGTEYLEMNKKDDKINKNYRRKINKKSKL